MNPTIDILNAHRSVRTFTADPVPAEHLEAAVHAGQMASTSSAVQAYCAIDITDADTRREIAELSGGQAQVESAPTFLLVCADTRRHRLAAIDANQPHDTRLEAFLIAAIDASLFAQNVVVAFESMGYGICYIGGIRNDLPRLDALLGLPEGVYPLFGLCVGTPAARDGATPLQRPRLPLGAVLMQDRYHDDETMRAHMQDYDDGYREYLRERGVKDSQLAAAWSPRMAEYHRVPRRPALAEHYISKGARLD